MTSKMRKAAGIKSNSECVKVIVRVRPLSHKEKANGNEEVAKIDSKNATVSVHNPDNSKANPKQFTFDGTYGPNSNQNDIYNQIVAPVVEDVLKGFNGTIFAYGQTVFSPPVSTLSFSKMEIRLPFPLCSEDFKWEKRISQGAFSNVFVVKHQASGKDFPYVCKVIRKQDANVRRKTEKP